MGNANCKVNFNASLCMYLLRLLHSYIMLFLLIARLLNNASLKITLEKASFIFL